MKKLASKINELDVPFRNKNKGLLLKTLPFVFGIIIIKYIFHSLGLEVLELNALFTSFVAANVFLLGFLLAGVLTDFKESEKLPGELSVHLESLADEAQSIYKTKGIQEAKECFDHINQLTTCLIQWFHKKERTFVVFEHLGKFNDFFRSFESHTQANFIVRLKQEQASIRRIITRIDTIRDTSFISSGYYIAELNSLLLISGLIVLRLDPFLNALFLTASVSLLFLYMMFLIKDLDDPFAFSHKKSFENVSLKTIEDFQERLSRQRV